MTSTVAPPLPPSGNADHDLGTLRRTAVGVVSSEWSKLVSLRSTIWSLTMLVVVSVGFTGLFSWFTVRYWDEIDPMSQLLIVADPARQILGAGFQFGQLAVCILGVLVVTSEYASGTIRASFLAVPSRIPVLAAKSGVFVVVIFVVGELAAFPAFFVGAGVMNERAPVALSDPGVLRAVIGAGLYLAVLGVIAIAVGSIVRHTAGAITVMIASVLVLPVLTQLIPGTVGNYLQAYLPSQAGTLIASPQQAPNDLLTPWQGFGVATIWAAMLLGVAAILLERRDA